MRPLGRLMSLIRVFIAIAVPPSVQDAVEELQERVKESRVPIRWVKPSHLHLTLKFLGNVNEEQIENIKESLIKAAREVNTFSLKASEIGVFPNINYPRVLWLGFEDESGQVHKLEKNIEFNLQKVGFKPEDRKFKPHLTIGRVKSLKGKTDIIRMVHNEKNISCDDFFVESFKLIKSDLKPFGPEYTVLHTFDLKEDKLELSRKNS